LHHTPADVPIKFPPLKKALNIYCSKYYFIAEGIYSWYNKTVFSMKFEWDEDKNLANIGKHGISFEMALRVFLDPKRKIRFNTKHSSTEMRYYCIGMVGGRVLTVRFIIRGSKVRIIGAGYWREGRKFYEKN
jgi:uncharacterized protein